MKEKYWADVGRALAILLVCLMLTWLVFILMELSYKEEHGELIGIEECMLIEGNFNQSYHIYKDDIEVESYSIGSKNGYFECKTEEVREKDMWKRINLEKALRISGGKRNE